MNITFYLSEGLKLPVLKLVNIIFYLSACLILGTSLIQSQHLILERLLDLPLATFNITKS